MTTFRTRLVVNIAVLALIATACGGINGSQAGGAEATTAPAPAERAPQLDGEPAPESAFTLFDGSTATLADFRGRPVVLNFWASWCPSCVAEMSSAFRPVQEALGDEITFLGMNIQDERRLAERLLAETGVVWTSAEDPRGELYIEFGGLGMPFTVYIDAAGNVVHEHNGPLDEALLRAQIADNLGVTS